MNSVDGCVLKTYNLTSSQTLSQAYSKGCEYEPGYSFQPREQEATDIAV